MVTENKITYTTLIKASVEKVWDGMTNPEIVKQYFFGTELISDWKVGSSITFQGEWEGKPYRDKGVILELEENKKIAYSYLSNWSGKEDLPENYLWVCYEFNSIGDNTELTIHQSNYEAETANHSEGNWASLIDGLKKIVE